MSGRLIFRILASLMLAVMSGSALAGCTAGAPHVEMKGPEGSRIKVMLGVDPGNIAVSAPFKALVTTCAERSVSVKRVTIDATMPRHRHGMNYLPTLKKTGIDSYTASGMLFHMPGLWRIEVAVSANGKTQRFFHDIEVE